jgi:carboxypeptidase T
MRKGDPVAILLSGWLTLCTPGALADARMDGTTARASTAVEVSKAEATGFASVAATESSAAGEAEQEPDLQHADQQPAAAASEPPTFAGGYRTIATIYSQLASIAAAYPGIAELVDFGDSYSKSAGGVTTPGGDFIAGYDLLALKVTNRSVPRPKPTFVLVGNTHARELVTGEIAMRMLDWLVTGYGHDADATWLVDAHEIWIVPVVNPDGHWYVELGTRPPYNGLPFDWRKNGNASSGGGSWPPTSTNTYGVDVNRNHPFKWGGPGASVNPGAWDYRGAAPGSEPEAAALMSLLRSLYPDQRGPALTDPAPGDASGILVSLHSTFSLVLWPWSYTTRSAAPNAAGLSAIGRKLATFNGYGAGQWSTRMYVSSGTLDDWLYGELGLATFTIEMGKNRPTMSELETVWSKNRGALIYAAKLARTPYLTATGPDVGSLSATAGASLVSISATASDATSGGDVIAAAECYVNIPPWQPGAAAQPLAPSDGRFDTATEDVTATLNTVGLGPGRHTLYLRSQDVLGNWGPVSAIFFDPAAQAGPYGAWKLDEGSGSVAFDSAGIASNLALTGAEWASPGHEGAGSALRFDGVDDLAAANGSNEFDAMDAVTVSAWIYPHSGGEGSKGRVVDKADGVSPTRGWIFHLAGDGRSLSFIVDFGSTDLTRASAAGVLIFDQWQHVAVTWNGSASAAGVHLYVNGMEVRYAVSTNGTGARVDDSAQDLKIGNDKSRARTFDGLIDEVHVWRRVLSAAEIAALAKPQPATDALGYWKFDEGSGPTASDSAGTPSDVTLLNGTTWDAGHPGTALRFDGADDMARTSGSDEFDAMPAVSVSAWINPGSGGKSNKGRIVDKANTVTPTNGWIFHLTGDGRTLSFIADYSSIDLTRASSAGVLTFNTWQHVAMTWDGSASASGVHLYVNGVEVAYSSFISGAGTRVDDSLQDLKIGNDKSTVRTFRGRIDEVQVWNRVLSPAEIEALAR